MPQLSDDEQRARLAEWKKLVENVRKQISDTDDRLRAMGIEDPEALRSVLPPKVKEEAERLVAQQLADVDREVAEARRNESGSPRPKVGTKIRRMV